MEFRIRQHFGESDLAFAKRRLKTTCLVLAFVLVAFLLWWPIFPAATDYGAIVWFFSGFVSLLLVFSAVVVSLCVIFSGCAYGWFLLEKRYEHMRLLRIRAGIATRLFIILFALTVSVSALVNALMQRTIPQLRRFGGQPDIISLDGDPLFFYFYVILWFVVACFSVFGLYFWIYRNGRRR